MKIKNYILILTLLMFVPFLASTKGQKKEIYIQLYSVRNDIGKDFKGTVSAVGKMGYTGIEAAGYSDGKFYGLSPEEFKKEIEANGLTVLSSHLNKWLANDIAKTDCNDVCLVGYRN